MKFFMPELDDEAVANQVNEIRNQGAKAIRRLNYEHGSSRFEVEVGRTRTEFRRQIGPRGGYRKNADYERLGRSTGGTVVLILAKVGLIKVYSATPGGWANPSLVSHQEVTGPVEYFDEFVGIADL